MVVMMVIVVVVFIGVIAVVIVVMVAMVIIILIMVVSIGEEVTAFLLSDVCNMRNCCDGEINLCKYLYRFIHFEHP
jgi:hypothetical protein